MLPLLQFAGDRQEHSLRETIDGLGDVFGLSPDERRELLPSGRQEVFDNRDGWARTYLTKAGLPQTTRRGHYEIAQRGLDGGRSCKLDPNSGVKTDVPKPCCFTPWTLGSTLGNMAPESNFWVAVRLAPRAGMT